MRPVICMITKGVQSDQEEAVLIDRITAAARAGVHLIQIRQSHMEGRALVRLAGRAVAAARGTDARILINDRVDVALAVGAHGVHLKEASIAARRVRTVAPAGFVIGRSVHSPEEGARVASEGGLDFLMLGTVFETTSKPTVRPAGLTALAAACAAVTLPVLGVGGMMPRRLRDVASTGCAGFAAIELFAATAVERLPVIVEEATSAFDTRRPNALGPEVQQWPRR